MSTSNVTERIVDLATVIAAIGAAAVAVVVFLTPADDGPSSDLLAQGTVENWEEYSERGHRLGPDDASVTIIEFGNYQCPFCRDGHPQVREILRMYPGEVALIYRHLPLEGQPRSYPAARAAECAGEQDAFWVYHDLLYGNDTWMEDDEASSFTKLAEEAGVRDIDAFAACLARDDRLESIAADERAASAAGFWGTPSYLINGQRHIGVLDTNRLQAIIEALGP